MKKTLVISLLLLFLVLVWFSWKWYKETIVCCAEESTPVNVQYGSLIFDCDTREVITNELWPEKKREIIAMRSKGKKLLLVGPYFGSESEQAGIERAERVKALFTELPSEDILTNARKVEDCESTKINMLHELKYKWITINDEVIESLDKTMVFYKYNSDKIISNGNTQSYFEDLSKFLKSSGNEIIITGHTSSEGEEEYNKNLGMKRAQEYKNYLIRLGVNDNQISIQSKGETKPIASNETEEGRAKNRRVEIKITK